MMDAMYRPSKRVVLYLLAVTAVVGSLAIGCSAGGSSQSATTTHSGQFQPGQGRGNPPDMTAMLTQVAGELGIPEDTLASAYQQARDSVMASMPPGKSELSRSGAGISQYSRRQTEFRQLSNGHLQ